MYRSGALTDSKKSRECADRWQSGNEIYLDGTITKGAERRTRMSLEIEDNDIVALFNALVKRDRKKIAQLQKEKYQLEIQLQKEKTRQREDAEWWEQEARFLRNVMWRSIGWQLRTRTKLLRLKA